MCDWLTLAVPDRDALAPLQALGCDLEPATHPALPPAGERTPWQRFLVTLGGCSCKLFGADARGDHGLRDALLATSGSLQLVSGGSPVWPDLPAEILQANPAFLDDNATRTKGWYPSPRERQSVRSVFLVQKRTVRVPFMETFDLPENSTSCARGSAHVHGAYARTRMRARRPAQTHTKRTHTYTCAPHARARTRYVRA